MRWKVLDCQSSQSISLIPRLSINCGGGKESLVSESDFLYLLGQFQLSGSLYCLLRSSSLLAGFDGSTLLLQENPSQETYYYFKTLSKITSIP